MKLLALFLCLAGLMEAEAKKVTAFSEKKLEELVAENKRTYRVLARRITVAEQSMSRIKPRDLTILERELRAAQMRQEASRALARLIRESVSREEIRLTQKLKRLLQELEAEYLIPLGCRVEQLIRNERSLNRPTRPVSFLLD